MAVRRLHSLIKLILLLSSCIYCIESIAVMSVDFGGEFMKIAIVKPGIPMEVVLNKESQRKTPIVVSLRNGERLIGEPALQLSTRFPKNAVKFLTTILGKKLDHPYVELYKQRFPYYDLAQDAETGGVLFKMEDKEYRPEELVAMLLDKAREVAEAFTEQTIKDIVVTVPAFYNQAERRAMIRAVQLLDMNLLQLMSDNAAVALNYGVFRRKEFNSTAQVFMFYDMGATSTTASIVSYQVVKMKDRGFAEDNPQLQVLGVGFDQTLGGLAFQLRLRDHLVKAFNQKKKIKTDVSKNERALAKLMKEAGRVLKVLSANSETYAQIEGLIEDIDFRHKVTRDEFETMCSDLFDRVSKPVTDAFLTSQVTEHEIIEVILMGGGTRIPKVQDTLLKVTGKKDLGKSINTDEAAVMGAVYQAAYLSKGYKVKRFGVKEAAIYPIQVEFERVRSEEELGQESKIIKRTLFNRMNPFPQKKVMTFNKHQKDFGFQVKYGDLSFLTKDERKAFGDLSLAKVDMSGVTSAHQSHRDDTVKGTKAHFRMDESGIISLAQAESVFEKEKPAEEESTLSKLGSTISNLFSGKEGEENKAEEEKKDAKEGEEKKEEPKSEEKTEEKKEEKPEEKTEEKKEPAEETKTNEKTSEGQKTESTGSESDGKTDKSESKEKTDSAKTDSEKAEKAAKNETSKEPAKPKILVMKENITITATQLDARDPSDEQLKASKAMLDDLRKIEKEKVELEKSKNDLESYILQGRERMYQDEYQKCSTETERENLEKKFSEHSDWLDEEGETADVETFRKHLIDLKTETWAFYDRVNEYKERPKLVETMLSMINHTEHFYSSIKNVSDPNDPMFTEVEITTLSKNIVETKTWFNAAWKQLNDSDPTKKAPYNREDFSTKLGVLDREIKYLINKAKSFRPKPKPTSAPNATNTTAANETTTADGVKVEESEGGEDAKVEDEKESEETKEEKKLEEEPLQLDGADTPKPLEEPNTETADAKPEKTKPSGHDPIDEL